MINFNFNNISREQLSMIAQNAIKALADKNNSDIFKLTISVDGDLDYSIDPLSDFKPATIYEERAFSSGGSHATPSDCSL